MMTLQEFRVFCENRADFKELWNNLVVQALRLGEQESKDVLKIRQKNVALTEEELALLKELKDNFISATDELGNVCARNNILAPPFTLNKICDLYS